MKNMLDDGLSFYDHSEEQEEFNPDCKKAEELSYSLIYLGLDNNEKYLYYNAKMKFYCDKYRNYFCDIVADDEIKHTVKITIRTSQNKLNGNVAFRVAPKLQKVYTCEVVGKE